MQSAIQIIGKINIKEIKITLINKKIEGAQQCENQTKKVRISTYNNERNGLIKLNITNHSRESSYLHSIRSRI